MRINDERHEELAEKYKRRNLREELCYMAYYQPDRPCKSDREFQAWLCMAALKRIRELEGTASRDEEAKAKCNHNYLTANNTVYVFTESDIDICFEKVENIRFCPLCGMELEGKQKRNGEKG